MYKHVMESIICLFLHWMLPPDHSLLLIQSGLAAASAHLSAPLSPAFPDSLPVLELLSPESCVS